MPECAITDEQVRFYNDNGYLIARGVLQGEELRRVQQVMQDMYELGAAEQLDHPDFFYAPGHVSGVQKLNRIEYVIDKDKTDTMKVLLGNPFILRSTEKLMGPDLIPTWDSMVLKAPSEGIIVHWHRDAGSHQCGDKPIFNVDMYLDRATEENCVWVVPGTHKLSQQEVDVWLKAHQGDMSPGDFRATGAVPALMQPGDVLFHDILVIHGSPATTAKTLRRVVYYEFRTAHVEEAIGPHTPAYIPLKQKMLLACIERRKQADWIPGGETPFTYRPPAPYDGVTLATGEELPTYRYAHEDYWR